MENPDQGLSGIRDKARHMADAGRYTAGEAARVLRDILEERPLLVIGAVAAASYLIARFGSIRARHGRKARRTSGRVGRRSRRGLIGNTAPFRWRPP
jgi:hypothetical protein